VNNWYTARQNAGLYTSTENNIVVSILIDDYNRAGISLLLKRYKEAAISSLYANKSIYNSNVYQNPVERRLQNLVEFIKAYYASIGEIKELGNLLTLSIELYYLITKTLLFKDLVYGTFCRLLELNGANIKDINSFIAKRFSYLDKRLYHFCLCCGWIV